MEAAEFGPVLDQQALVSAVAGLAIGVVAVAINVETNYKRAMYAPVQVSAVRV